MAKSKDIVIQPDKMIINTLTTVQYKERAKVKENKLKENK